jgi:hypothetical protein
VDALWSTVAAKLDNDNWRGCMGQKRGIWGIARFRCLRLFYNILAALISSLMVATLTLNEFPPVHNFQWHDLPRCFSVAPPCVLSSRAMLSTMLLFPLRRPREPPTQRPGNRFGSPPILLDWAIIKFLRVDALGYRGQERSLEGYSLAAAGLSALFAHCHYRLQSGCGRAVEAWVQRNGQNVAATTWVANHESSARRTWTS